MKYPIAWPLLIKTIVIQAHFSKLYQEWNEFPILVPELEKAYRTRPTEDNMALSGTDQSLTDIEVFGTGNPAELVTFSSTGLLYKYLTNRRKYRPLEQMLAFGEESTEETQPQNRQLFGGLARGELMAYFHLTNTATDTQPLLEATNVDLWASLLSGDPVRIKDAVQSLREKETVRQGVLDLYRYKLAEILKTDREHSSIDERLSAGMALSYLGDPVQAYRASRRWYPFRRASSSTAKRTS